MDYEETSTQVTAEVKNWLEQLAQARKREQDFRKQGRRVTRIYEAEAKEDNEFNILYANTETLAPALYNNLPRPVVQRRFKDDDPVGLLAATTTQRTLEFLLDSNDRDHSNFDDMIRQAVLEALLPGRGVTRFKYEATFTPMQEAAEGEVPEVDGEAEDSADALGIQTGDSPAELVEAETVVGEEVPWDRFLHGYAKKWKDVPWVAFEHFMNKEELEQNFGLELAARIPRNICGGREASEGEEGEGLSLEELKEIEGEKFAQVYEVWDKGSKSVLFVAEGFGEVVKRVEDPLGLSGFFPCPKPLSFMAKVSGLVPTALYLMYEEQARELNTVTRRINRVMRALKVRGFYDSTLSGLDNLLASDDNTLMPTENVAAMLQGQTLDKAIWLFPIEKLVGVLQQLYLQRVQIKETIYEVTGISDIIRGSSVASETATAQNIKNQWGTLRLKRMQKEVQRYVRDCLRIMAEVAMTKLQPETIAQMTGLQYPTAEQKQQAQAIAQQLQTQPQAQMQAQPPGAPPQPPQLPPELQQTLASPSWDDVLGLLKDDLQRAYRIDIETNSTVDEAATEDQQNIGEFLNALSQFLNGIAPMVEQGIMPFEAAKAMLLAISRRYRFGDEVEEQLKTMQAPQPKGEGDDGSQAKAEQAKVELQAKQAELQMKMQLAQATMQAKMQELAQKQELAQAQHGLKLQEIALRQREFAARAAAGQETAKGA